MPEPPPSRKQVKLRARAERKAARLVEPPAAVALRRVLGWQAEINAGLVTQADIARREDFTRARVCQLMRLVRLPDHIKEKLRANDPSMATLTVTRAIQMSTATWSNRLRLISSATEGVGA